MEQDAWYWKLGFSTNPFSIKPGSLSNDIIGHQVEPILQKMEQGSIQFIHAPFGQGKTSMLKSIISAFGGKKKIAYTSCIDKETINLRNLLRNATISGKIFGIMPSDMILLVDEAQEMSKEDAESVMAYYTKGTIKSIAFFGTEYQARHYPNALSQVLNGNLIHLNTLTEEQAIDLVRKRIGKLKILPDYVIREVYKKSDGSPRRLLQHCEDLCKKAVELSIPELTATHVSSLLSPLPRARRATRTARKPKAKRAPKKRKAGAIIKERIQERVPADATYNVNNIRTYEEELGINLQDDLDRT
jgi:replication-associated recombination protein RarA